MSRSYKHTPIAKGGGMGKFAKKWANKRVRQATDIGNYHFYKRLLDTWDIYDYRYYNFNCGYKDLMK